MFIPASNCLKKKSHSINDLLYLMELQISICNFFNVISQDKFFL